MDYFQFKDEYKLFEKTEEDIFKTADMVDKLSLQLDRTDMVNSPAHYTQGGQEAIEIIEGAVDHAPSGQLAVFHGNALKYLLRLWLKKNPLEDARKAKWYLDRLISKLEGK